jgi:hypothetical protein
MICILLEGHSPFSTGLLGKSSPLLSEHERAATEIIL